jgi:hypothetical protein
MLTFMLFSQDNEGDVNGKETAIPQSTSMDNDKLIIAPHYLKSTNGNSSKTENRIITQVDSFNLRKCTMNNFICNVYADVNTQRCRPEPSSILYRSTRLELFEQS